MGFFHAGPTRAYVQDLGARLTLRLVRPPDLSGVIYGALVVVISVTFDLGLADRVVQGTQIPWRGIPGGPSLSAWAGAAVLIAAATMMLAVLPLFFFVKLVASDEVVELTPEYLTLNRRIAGMGRARIYQRQLMHQLGHASQIREVAETPAGPPTLVETAWLQFFYEDKLVVFGIHLPLIEAQRLGGMLQAHYPEVE